MDSYIIIVNGLYNNFIEYYETFLTLDPKNKPADKIREVMMFIPEKRLYRSFEYANIMPEKYSNIKSSNGHFDVRIDNILSGNIGDLPNMAKETAEKIINSRKIARSMNKPLGDSIVQIVNPLIADDKKIDLYNQIFIETANNLNKNDNKLYVIHFDYIYRP
ncbi:MAG: hypothetical protein QXL18_05185 [Candidatus Woesearchaeota archaeon]